MLPTKLMITLGIALTAYFILILVFLKHRAIELRYTLLWIFSGMVMGIMLLFPHAFRASINLLGITSTMNGLFIFFIGILIMICMSLTSIVSRQANKLRTLTQELAILEKRIRELERADIRTISALRSSPDTGPPISGNTSQDYPDGSEQRTQTGHSASA